MEPSKAWTQAGVTKTPNKLPHAELNTAAASSPPDDFVSTITILTCVEIKFDGAFVVNHRVDLHAIDAPPARWRGDAGSSSLDGASTAASSSRNDFHTAADAVA